MLWRLDGELEASDVFGRLEVSEVLDADEAPTLFTVVRPTGQFLIYESSIDATDRIYRYLAVCLTGETKEHLLQGKMSLHDALNRNIVWAIDASFDGSQMTVVRLHEGLKSVPVGYKPEPGARLMADHHYVT
jgi:hypothetical protein